MGLLWISIGAPSTPDPSFLLVCLTILCPFCISHHLQLAPVRFSSNRSERKLAPRVYYVHRRGPLHYFKSSLHLLGRDSHSAHSLVRTQCSATPYSEAHRYQAAGASLWAWLQLIPHMFIPVCPGNPFYK
jgi:hypothetical protein